MTPSDNDQDSVLNRILNRVPGYTGYQRQESRRTSDEKARAYIVEQLSRCKPGLDAYTKSLANSGQLSELPRWEQLRSTLDQLITHVKSRVISYGGIFDQEHIDEDALEDVYDFDADLLAKIDGLVEQFQQLSKGNSPENADPLSPITESLNDVHHSVKQRDDMLRKLLPES